MWILDRCSPFKALTHSSLVSLRISWPPMARIWSPSTIPPQLQPALAAGLSGLQHWMYSLLTASLARPPPSNRRPNPSFSPGLRAMVMSSSVKSQASSSSRHWMAMSRVVAGKHPTSEITTAGVTPINHFTGHNGTEVKTVT